jgi:hypothetical protein
MPTKKTETPENAPLEPIPAPAPAIEPIPAPAAIAPIQPAPLAPLPPPAFPQTMKKPGKVQAIAIMTLISGVLNCFWGLSAAVSLFAANFFACYWAPYAITLGVLEIIYAAKLLGSNPTKLQPAKYLAIMQIINISTLNVYQLFVGDVVVGILALVFYNDPEVQAYFAYINRQA